MDDLFKNKVKIAFSKVKNDIFTIKSNLEEIKSLLRENNTKTPKKESSTGNEGVYSFIHSLGIHSLNTKESPIQAISTDLNSHFLNLTKQELLVLLSIYQFEDDKGPITYLQLSEMLKLSEGCIRTYVSALIKKGIPVLKSKLNNKITVLTIDKSLRDLNLKQKLSNLYYQNDPHQRTLHGL